MAATSTCQFDQYWRSDCRLRISKLGDVQVKSKFDFCTSPPLLDVSVQVEQHTWKLSFVASNRRESRIIGLEYWPLRLHVNFFQEEENGGIGQSVLGCMESLKNGEELCFLNTTVGTSRDQLEPYAPCQLSEASSSSTTSIAILCLLVTVLLVALSLGSFTWWRRRILNKRNQKRRLETCVPPLPQSKPYVDQSIQDKSKCSVSIVSRSRPILNPITEEESSSNHFFIHTDEDDSGNKNSLRWRESKLIQTSLPSLEAAQLLIAESDRAASSSGSSQDTASPSGLCPQTNDKEKLICSSSSSESSV